MLLVQKFLEEHTFKELQEKHGVYASFSKSGHKFSLNYDQIEATESDPLSQDCRGLILSLYDGQTVVGQVMPDGKLNRDNIMPGNTKILAYPMKRFFNYGQGAAAPINWSDPNLAILEKLDGTLCIVYYDSISGVWCMATRSVPEADLLMDNGIFTFRTLFEKALFETTNLSFDDYTSKLDREITYCFELTTPYNRVVVAYQKSFITLLSARHIIYGMEAVADGKGWSSFNEIDIKTIPTFGVPIVQSYTYTSISELVDWVSTLNPMEHEGIVVRDSNFNRIKVKNASYVAYNKLNDRLGTSERNCLEIILQEKDDDVAAFLPEEIVKNLQKIKVGFQKAIKEHDMVYETLLRECDLIKPGDKKTFAIGLNGINESLSKKLWTAPFFQIYDKKASSMKDFIQKNRKDGTWSSSFLDKLLEISKTFS